MQRQNFPHRSNEYKLLLGYSPKASSVSPTRFVRNQWVNRNRSRSNFLTFKKKVPTHCEVNECLLRVYRLCTKWSERVWYALNDIFFRQKWGSCIETQFTGDLETNMNTLDGVRWAFPSMPCAAVVLASTRLCDGQTISQGLCVYETAACWPSHWTQITCVCWFIVCEGNWVRLLFVQDPKEK